MEHEDAGLKQARAECEQARADYEQACADYEAIRRKKEQGFIELQEAMKQCPLGPEDIAELTRLGWSGKPKQKGPEKGSFNASGRWIWE